MWPWRTPAAPDPGGLTYVIGDIHGCTDLLVKLLDLIKADAAGRAYRLIALGDYVDRGPDSAGTLALLHQMGDRIICLMGNHDRMLLDFLEDPQGHALRWLGNGGDATLRSFGVSILIPVTEQAGALADAMGPGLIAWLGACPLWWQSGDLMAVHAYTNPAVPMAGQSEALLLWGRPPRLQKPRADGAWVVHGHTIVPKPRLRKGHIAIDTGAYSGNALTAAAFDGGSVRFLSAPARIG